jgi:prepilin-type N-terminal cleavage/methylation domain-containing protein
MRTKAFTLYEILITIVILGILVTLVLIPAYQGALNASQEQVCTANQQVLKTALDIYAMEHDAMPGSLSELPGSYTRRAYAKVMTGYTKFVTKIATAIISWDERGKAYAQNFMRNYLTKGDLKLMTCPSDSTPPSSGGISYGLNAGLAGMSSARYKALPANVLILADSDSATLANIGSFTYPHGKTLLNYRGKVNAITKGGTKQTVRQDDTCALSQVVIYVPGS